MLIGQLHMVLSAGKITREGGTLRGSGTNDIKGGDVVPNYALKALHAAAALDDTQIIVSLTGDEEAPGDPVAMAAASCWPPRNAAIWSSPPKLPSATRRR